MIDRSNVPTPSSPIAGLRKEHLSLSLILALVAVISIVVLGIFETIPRREAPKAAAPTATEQAIQDLKSSKEELAGQLREVQQRLSSDQTERKRLSDAVTVLSNKLEALQQSFARVQELPVAPSTEPAKRSRGSR